MAADNAHSIDTLVDELMAATHHEQLLQSEIDMLQRSSAGLQHRATSLDEETRALRTALAEKESQLAVVAEDLQDAQDAWRHQADRTATVTAELEATQARLAMVASERDAHVDELAATQERHDAALDECDEALASTQQV